MKNHQHRIEKIFLDEVTLASLSENIRTERETAIADLTAENYFFLNQSHEEGPYSLYFTLADNRLLIGVTHQEKQLSKISLPLKPLRTIIRDYFLICESYAKVVEANDPRKVEAIDMGRRGVHNEGSELLKELLEPEVEVDFDTARRLFALICALHMK